MKEMIKKYRGSLISSILVIFVGVLVGFTSTHGKWIGASDDEGNDKKI